MTVKDLRLLLEKLPQDHEVCFICPDGFCDSIEDAYQVDEKEVLFYSYCHRQKEQNGLLV